MINKEFVEEECIRLAKELVETGRLSADELAYWMTYISKRGYELGYVDSNNDRWNPPTSNHVPKLYISAPKE